MEIKLKQGSSVKILDHSGNEIIEVHEDGTIDGISGGAKLYVHHTVFDDEEIDIISTDGNQWQEQELGVFVHGSNCISMWCVTGNHPVFKLEYDQAWKMWTISSSTSIGEFVSDTVEEL